MAQYEPFESNVEVNGQAILSFVKALPAYQNELNEILKNHNLIDLKPQEWYSQKLWLDAFRQIGEEFGANTLFAIGKVIPESAIFPLQITDLESALRSLDIAYNMNHRGGDIGYYKVTEFILHAKLAIIECKNPYASYFDKGIITTIARKFKPANIIIINVELDESKPTRLNGAESCTFRISW